MEESATIRKFRIVQTEGWEIRIVTLSLLFVPSTKGGGMETTMLKRDYNWKVGYELAKVFGEQYSKDITILEFPQETCIEGNDYQLVQLSFPAKGNKLLKEQLLQTGFCTSMDGRIENGKRITNLLLWIETNPIAYHKVQWQAKI